MKEIFLIPLMFSFFFVVFTSIEAGAQNSQMLNNSHRGIANAKLRNNSQDHSLFFINSMDLTVEGSTPNRAAR